MDYECTHPVCEANLSFKSTPCPSNIVIKYYCTFCDEDISQSKVSQLIKNLHQIADHIDIMKDKMIKISKIEE